MIIGGIMKRKSIIRIISVILTVSVLMCMFAYSSSAVDDLETLKKKQSAATSEVERLRNKKASQEEQAKAVEKQLAATQALIDACNKKLNEYNSIINEKQKLIDEKNAEISEEKEAFRRRIRSIYMSSSKTGLQMMLTADSFADYLALSEMAQVLSAQDKALVEKITAAMDSIIAEQSEIIVLKDEQAKIKSDLDAQKADYKKQEANINSLIKATDADIKKAQNDLQKIQNEIVNQNGGGGIVYDGSSFVWPVKGYHTITAGIDSGDSVHKGTHHGIDIAGGSIKGKPILAAAAGRVYSCNNTCTHNYGKSRSCGCGSGYGNYVAIDHGTLNGVSYKTLYGHMTSTAVQNGQYVQKGQVIGYVGTTGWSTGPHLHFEFIVNGQYKDARKYPFQG